MADESDEAIYRRYRACGDERDLKTLLLRHRNGVMLFANAILNNFQDAEEVMLDAFAVTAASTTHFDGRSSFKTWLYSIARKLALSLVRKRRLHLVPLGDLSAHDEPDVDSQLLLSEQNRELYQKLDALRPDYRQVLHLLYLEQMSPEEVAHVMSRTKRQIYNLAERGRAALREELLREESTHA